MTAGGRWQVGVGGGQVGEVGLSARRRRLDSRRRRSALQFDKASDGGDTTKGQKTKVGRPPPAG